MNKYKIISVLTGGVLLFSIPGCISNPEKAQAFPDVPIAHHNVVDLVHTSKLNKNTIKMRQTLMKLFHRVNKTPYVFAGSSPYGWDCSGMVRWTYEQFGITLPHSATAQAKVGRRVSKPKIGDIVLFGYKGYKSFYHAAIYVGKNKVINANFGAGTTIIESLKDYAGSRIAFVRVVETI